MKQWMKRTVGLVLVLAGMTACASVPLKQKVVLSAQTIEHNLGIVQDTEKALYESGSVAALTPAVHKQINATLVKAFDDQIRLATAIRAWNAGDPPPASIQALLADANDTLGVVEKALAGNSNAAKLINQILDVTKAIEAVANQIGGK